MGVPVFFGWGKKGKIAGYVGIDKCPNCKNYSHFKLYEYANNVNLYFVPIVKWNKKLYLVCSTCDAAWELKDDMKSEMLDKALKTPAPQIVNKIWNKVDEIVAKNLENVIKKDSENWVELIISKCVAELCDEMPDIAIIREITLKYLQYIFDEDKAR